MPKECISASYNTFTYHIGQSVLDNFGLYADEAVRKREIREVGTCLLCGETIYSKYNRRSKFCSRSHAVIYHHRNGTFKKIKKPKYLPNKIPTEVVQNELLSIPTVIYD